MTQVECEHDEVGWIAADDARVALSEAGWTCVDCDTSLGFRPDLDRAYTELKVHAILLDFHESKLIYISNGTEGGIIADNVALRCRDERRYDQWSILRFILEDPNLNGHGDFWANRAERWLRGGEPIRNDQTALPF
jgi:hypothetical protein